MWDRPGPGIEPVSPALAGGFLTTAPPEKSLGEYLKNRDSQVSPQSQLIRISGGAAGTFFHLKVLPSDSGAVAGPLLMD